jgi:rhodanese-related sulfurtransferase
MLGRLLGLKRISPRALYQLMQRERITVIDVNAAASWVGAHLPGARNLDPGGYSEGELPLDKATPLVFYCANFMCRRAPTAARRAQRMGYRDVRIISAGINGWRNASLPIESGA